MKDGEPGMELNTVIPCKALGKAPEAIQMRGVRREQCGSRAMLPLTRPLPPQSPCGCGFGDSGRSPSEQARAEAEVPSTTDGLEEKGVGKAGLGQCQAHLGMAWVPPVPLGLRTLGLFEPGAKPKSTLRLRCKAPRVAQMTTVWTEQGWGMSLATPVSLELQDLFL